MQTNIHRNMHAQLYIHNIYKLYIIHIVSTELKCRISTLPSLYQWPPQCIIYYVHHPICWWYPVFYPYKSPKTLFLSDSKCWTLFYNRMLCCQKFSKILERNCLYLIINQIRKVVLIIIPGNCLLKVIPSPKMATQHFLGFMLMITWHGMHT